MKKIDIIYFKAGSGHAATAIALKGELIQRGHTVHLTDLRDVLDPIDKVHKFTGIKVEEFYNWLIKHGITYGQPAQLKIAQLLIRLNSTNIIQALTKYWLDNPPDLVVSVIPNFNRLIYRSISETFLRIKMCIVMTDLHNSYPHFWLEKNLRALVIVPTEKALQEAEQANCPAVKISGLVVNSTFYSKPDPRDILFNKERLGFNNHMPIGVVMFGGCGSARMLKLAKWFANVNTQLIFLCGNNPKLQNAITRLGYHRGRISGETGNQWVVQGYTDQVPFFFAMADYFVGKPGPGCIAEALVSGLPLLLEDRHTMKQEKYNLEWVQDKHVGFVTNNAGRDLDLMLEFISHPATKGYIEQQISQLGNRALYEAVDIIGA